MMTPMWKKKRIARRFCDAAICLVTTFLVGCGFDTFEAISTVPHPNTAEEPPEIETAPDDVEEETEVPEEDTSPDNQEKETAREDVEEESEMPEEDTSQGSPETDTEPDDADTTTNPPGPDTSSDTPETETTSDSLDTETISESDSYEVDRALLFEMMGYATVDGLGHGPTTGGAGDPDPVTVTSAEELRQVIDDKESDPLIVYIDRTLTNSEGGRIVIKDTSDISILGLGDRAELDGFGLTLTRVSNIVIRNLKIHHVDRDDGDAVKISESSHHIWIDHCEIYNDGRTIEGNYDGLIDITHRCDYITISWSYFHDSLKGLLVGHSDDNRDEDEGSFHVTYHHNYLERIGSGVPSVRFGTVHVWNNYYRDIISFEEGTGIAVSSRMEACVRVEGNLFRDVHTPVKTDQSGDDDETLGQVTLHDNEYIGYTALSESPTCSLTPPYEYEEVLLPLDILAVEVPAGVGTGQVDARTGGI